MTTRQQALQRYNAHFDNAQYLALGDLLAADLKAARDSLAVSDTMNLVTNVALSLCGYDAYEGDWVQLAVVCAQAGVSDETIMAIVQYLRLFQPSRDTTPDDFELTARALRHAAMVSEPLQTTISCTNGVHGWRRRMAYHLLTAADYLVQAAVQLLMHGNLSYIREKLSQGLRHISYALREGQQHSSHPALFQMAGKPDSDSNLR